MTIPYHMEIMGGFRSDRTYNWVGGWTNPSEKYSSKWASSLDRCENRKYLKFHHLDTPPKFNMEPENDGFQKESPFPGTSFQVPC